MKEYKAQNIEGLNAKRTVRNVVIRNGRIFGTYSDGGQVVVEKVLSEHWMEVYIEEGSPVRVYSGGKSFGDREEHTNVFPSIREAVDAIENFRKSFDHEDEEEEQDPSSLGVAGRSVYRTYEEWKRITEEIEALERVVRLLETKGPPETDKAIRLIADRAIDLRKERIDIEMVLRSIFDVAIGFGKVFVHRNETDSDGDIYRTRYISFEYEPGYSDLGSSIEIAQVEIPTSLFDKVMGLR